MNVRGRLEGRLTAALRKATGGEDCPAIVAPSARPDDGLLDMVRIVHAGLLQRLRGLGKLRSGAFVDLPHVDYRTARHVEVTAEGRVPVETDGEPVGIVPATFDLLPARLPVIC